MTIFYSKTESAFFDSEIHGEKIPRDAVEITEEDHRQLLAGQAAGKIIAANDSGQPINIDRPDPVLTIQQQIAALEATQTLRRMRDTSPEGLEWLENLEAEIEALRAQL